MDKGAETQRVESIPVVSHPVVEDYETRRVLKIMRALFVFWGKFEILPVVSSFPRTLSGILWYLANAVAYYGALPEIDDNIHDCTRDLMIVWN